MKTSKKLIAALSALLVLISLSSQNAYADNDKNKGKSDKKEVMSQENKNSYCAKSLTKAEENQFIAAGMMKNRMQVFVPNPMVSSIARDAQSLIRKLSSKKAQASGLAAAATLKTALNTYNTTRANAITTYNNTAATLKKQCDTAVLPFKTTLNAALVAAKNAFELVNTNVASTPAQIDTARAAYNAAVALANTTFVNATRAAITTYQTQMNLAQTNLFSASTQAGQLLKNAIQTAKLSL